jgi:hypothetical protein
MPAMRRRHSLQSRQPIEVWRGSSRCGLETGGANGDHHKLRYDSPDPFRCRTLTHVQLSQRSPSS